MVVCASMYADLFKNTKILFKIKNMFTCMDGPSIYNVLCLFCLMMEFPLYISDALFD